MKTLNRPSPALFRPRAGPGGAVRGRLIRGAEDKGCFVILEGAVPTRLLSAFPPDAPIKRCGLAEAVTEIREFLGEGA